MDQLHAISVFITVGEEGSFSSAAKRLNVSPASITRAVSQIEDRLGVRLFARSTRSVQLTEAGRRYLVDCQRILSELEEAERNAAGNYRIPRGTVTVTAPATFGRMAIAPVLLDLMDEYPGISFVTAFVDRLVHLIDEGIDIAVRFGELPDSSHVGVRVGSTRRVLCASPPYLAERGRPTMPKDLAGHDLIDLISMKHNGLWRLEKNGKSHAHRPTSRLQVNSPDVAITAALAGRGITRVASYMIADHLQAGTLEIVLEDYEPAPAPAHVLRKELGHVPGRVRAVFDCLVECLRTCPALDR